MYNVVTSFGNYPSNIALNEPGPYTAEELGLKWLEHCARYSKEGMLKNYRLVLILPRSVTIDHSYDSYLDCWGDRVRFDENSGVNAWPLGPNLVMQQTLWLYHYKKLSGPFLWCEPDCIPVKPTWLDDLFAEYADRGKAFMGAFVDQKNQHGQNIPRHMTGNGIYPDKAYEIAPLILEARLTPWDVYAAKQILPKCHYTTQIQHEYRHAEIMTRAEMERVVKPGTALFHTDKFGAIARLLDTEQGIEPPQIGKLDPDLDQMLATIAEMCRLSPQTRSKVAYFMLENNIVNGVFVHHFRRRKKEAQNVETVESDAGTLAT